MPVADSTQTHNDPDMMANHYCSSDENLMETGTIASDPLLPTSDSPSSLAITQQEGTHQHQGVVSHQQPGAYPASGGRSSPIEGEKGKLVSPEGPNTTTTEALKTRNGGGMETPVSVQPHLSSTNNSVEQVGKENPKRRNGGMDTTPGAIAIVHQTSRDDRTKADESYERYRTCSGGGGDHDRRNYKQSLDNYYWDDAGADDSCNHHDIENQEGGGGGGGGGVGSNSASNPLSRQQRIRPVSQPGAYPLGIGRNNADAAYFSDREEEEVVEEVDGSIITSGHQTAGEAVGHHDFLTTETNNNEGLVEANPVRDSEMFTNDNMEVAEPVDPNGDDFGTRQQKYRYGEKSFSLQIGLCGLAFILLVSVGLVIALLGRSSEGESQVRNVTNTPHDQSIPMEHLLALLPASTQAVIIKDTNTSSPQSKAYQWLRADPSFEEYDDARLLQRYAMAAMYYSLDGPNWANQGGEVVTIVKPIDKPGPPP